jgi:membrane-bound lytic murein transglycosylase D
MSHTARRYDLKVTNSVDERRSIIKSTEAAARYFQDLYNIFGNWELALSAYNAGEFGVIRRIRKANTRDFYTLIKNKVLPRETRNYVPKIKAAMEVYKNPARYGIKVPKVSQFRKSSLRKYTITKKTDVNKLSRRLGISKAKLLSLNTDIKHRSIPNFRSNFDLYIPKHAKAKKHVKSYRAVAASSSKVTKSNRRHKVKRGDNLIRIARNYKVWVKDIIANNSLKSKNVYIGQTLKIPASPDSSKYHLVKSGDHLTKIAKKYGLSITKIKKVNDMDNSKIYPGQKLIVSL